MRGWVMGILLLTAAGAKADAPEARGLYGAPTMVVAQQLGRKGFQMGRTYSSRGMEYAFFLHPHTGRCLQQTARNNATVAIVEQPTEACTGGGQAGWGPGGGGPGVQPGDGIYGEFIGMRTRDAERELRRRGYRQTNRGGGMQIWWHGERGICAALYAQGGYVRQANPEDPRACGQGIRPR